MARATKHPECQEFLEWCRHRGDALSRRAVVIADNLDDSNRTGHLHRGYRAAVHFLRENPEAQDWIRTLPLSERQPFDHETPEFARPWSDFMAKHGAKHTILRPLETAETHLLVRHRIAREHIDYVTEQFLIRLDLIAERPPGE